MGLDIAAYSNLILVAPEVKKALSRVPEISMGDGPRIMKMTKISDRGEGSRCLDMDAGDYYGTESTEEFDFRAGSYSGYGLFRRLLSEIFLHSDPAEVWKTPKAYKGQPFYELVDFSDCEGVIGPEVSSKLHSDFVEGRAQFFEECEDEWYRQKYDDWTKALSISKENGALIFC
jgi:hypothetical protein